MTVFNRYLQPRVRLCSTFTNEDRLVDSTNLETNEALLTGESLPVLKGADLTFSADTCPGDRMNIVFGSSTITNGHARGVVFATGMQTEIGSIAAALRASGKQKRTVKRDAAGAAKAYHYVQAWVLTLSDIIGRFLGISVRTPLQRKLSELAILLFGIAVICAIIVLAANSFSNKTEVIIYAVATGLSMIPACLVVVLTMTMAAGTKRMVKREVIVRKQDSLEALGAVTGEFFVYFQQSSVRVLLLHASSTTIGSSIAMTRPSLNTRTLCTHARLSEFGEILSWIYELGYQFDLTS